MWINSARFDLFGEMRKGLLDSVTSIAVIGKVSLFDAFYRNFFLGAVLTRVSGFASYGRYVINAVSSFEFFTKIDGTVVVFKAFGGLFKRKAQAFNLFLGGLGRGPFNGSLFISHRTPHFT